MASRRELVELLYNTRTAIHAIKALRMDIEHCGVDISNDLTLKYLELKVTEAQTRLTLFQSRNIKGDDI